MKTVLIQYHVEGILQENEIVILNCQPLVIGENYTEIKAWQLKSDSYFWKNYTEIKELQLKFP